MPLENGDTAAAGDDAGPLQREAKAVLQRALSAGQATLAEKGQVGSPASRTHLRRTPVVPLWLQTRGRRKPAEALQKTACRVNSKASKKECSKRERIEAPAFAIFSYIHTEGGSTFDGLAVAPAFSCAGLEGGGKERKKAQSINFLPGAPDRARRYWRFLEGVLTRKIPRAIPRELRAPPPPLAADGKSAMRETAREATGT